MAVPSWHMYWATKFHVKRLPACLAQKEKSWYVTLFHEGTASYAMLMVQGMQIRTAVLWQGTNCTLCATPAPAQTS